MPQFSYKARRRSGEVVEGMLDVADRPAALVQIERLGLFPVAIEAAKGAGAAVNDRPATTKLDLKALLPQSVQQSLAQKRKPRLQELATFTQQLANLLNNVPLSIWYDWKNDGPDPREVRARAALLRVQCELADRHGYDPAVQETQIANALSNLGVRQSPGPQAAAHHCNYETEKFLLLRRTSGHGR